MDLGRRTRRMRTRMILSAILLLVAVQWIGDPFEQERPTGDVSVTAAPRGSDGSEPDESHHLGILQLADDDAILTRLEDEPASLEVSRRIPPPLDPLDLYDFALTHRDPRAPPIA